MENSMGQRGKTMGFGSRQKQDDWENEVTDDSLIRFVLYGCVLTHTYQVVLGYLRVLFITPT